MRIIGKIFRKIWWSIFNREKAAAKREAKVRKATLDQIAKLLVYPWDNEEI